MQKITTFLWFDNHAEEAVNFYTSIFKNSKILKKARKPDSVPGPKDSVLTISFELNGQEFIAMNGGPSVTFNHAISLLVKCNDQEEIDHYWTKLTEGGQEIECGWLKDKYGLSWQICPANIDELISNPETSDRVMQAVMKMVKLDISKLEEAAKGK